MTLLQVQDLFERIKACDSVADLFEYKLNVQTEINELHKKLHQFKEDSGNLANGLTRNEVIGVLKASETLVEFMEQNQEVVKWRELGKLKEERKAKADMRTEEKKELQLTTKFMMVAKKCLPDVMYAYVLGMAKDMTQQEIEQMPENRIALEKTI